jgi:anion-transporting  ArsA/GET3 family ATPase
MMELQELFRDEAKSEFVVVTIASVLAVAESERLVKQLREQEVPVRHMVVSHIHQLVHLCNGHWHSYAAHHFNLQSMKTSLACLWVLVECIYVRNDS